MCSPPHAEADEREYDDDKSCYRGANSHGQHLPVHLALGTVVVPYNKQLKDTSFKAEFGFKGTVYVACKVRDFL